MEKNTLSGSKDSGKQKTVLVAMTGRVSSSVAAYLLKKQGLRPIGISVCFYGEEKEFEYDTSLFPGIQKQQFEKNKYYGPIRGHYHIENLEKVKKVCDNLEIPFYAVNAQDIFKEKILDPFVASRLMGEVFSPSAFAVKTIVEILIEKAKKLDADFIATGHFAKIQKSGEKKRVSVYTSNDLEFDQSHELSLVKQSELEKLMLPLSEMRSIETEKIASIIGVSREQVYRHADEVYRDDPRITSLVQRESPLSLRNEGEIYHYFNDIILGDHDGIHYYYPGKRKLSSRTTPVIDSSLAVVKIQPAYKRVILAPVDDMDYDHLVCRKYFSNGVEDITKITTAFLKIHGRNDKLPCHLIFKSNGNVVIKLSTKQSGRSFAGERVYFYSKQDKGGKLLATAIVHTSCNYKMGLLHEFPPRDEELQSIEDAQTNENANPYLTDLEHSRHHF